MNADSETDENWEEVSSDDLSNDDEKRTDNLQPRRPERVPWSYDQIKKTLADLNPMEHQKTIQKEEIHGFENGEQALSFIKKFDSNQFDDPETIKNLLTVLKPGYSQFGHDTNKPIIVEFDSLFINVLCTPLAKNFLKNEPQFLPLAFAAERFMKRITLGSRRVELHVFECFENAWTCPLLKLARKALLFHLKENAKLTVKKFKVWWGVEWIEMCMKTGVSAVLLSNCQGIDGPEYIKPVDYLRRLTVYTLTLPVRLVRLEELMFYSNAIFGFVCDVFSEVKDYLKLILNDLNETTPKIEFMNKMNQKERVDLNKEYLVKIREVLEPCEVITTFSVICVLKENLVGNLATKKTIFNAKVFVLCSELQRKISLRKRSEEMCLSQLKSDGNERDKESFIKKISSVLALMFDNFQMNEKKMICDLIDARLFMAIKNKILKDKNFEENMKRIYNEGLRKTWEVVTSILSDKNIPTDFFPLVRSDSESETKIPLETETSTDLESSFENKEVYPLHKIRGDTLKSLYEDIEKVLEEKEMIYDSDTQNREEGKYDEKTYINDELDSVMRNINNNKFVDDLEGIDMTHSIKFRSKLYTFMKKYSTSLASPKIVLRDVVVADVEEIKTDTKNEKTVKGNKKKKGGKGQKKKNDLREKIFASNALKKKQKAKDDIVIFIKQALKPLPLHEKIEKLDERLLPIKDPVIALPGQMQLLEWLIENYKKSNPSKNIEPATMLFRNIYDIYRRFRSSLTAAQVEKLQTALMIMGFSPEASRLVEDFNKYRGKKIAKNINHMNDTHCAPVGMNSIRFQLSHTGHLMVRSIKSREDPRVSGFYPDDWQIEFLDAVDRNESCLVVTPTSSGKTFISYYTMKKILEKNKAIDRMTEKGLVVFVCPTKALVNQVSADIYGRYGKIFGVETPDYSRSVLECEVLITVPASFERLLLSPPFESFVKMIKYVILDEIHSIGDSLGGEIWERIVLQLQCPFIALSATLGNPKIFHDWLKKVSNVSEIENTKPKVNLIEFYERWSDLVKYIYIPKDAENPKVTLRQMEHDHKKEKSSFYPINPLATFKLGYFTFENFSIPNVGLTSNECLQTFDAISKACLKNEELQKQILPLKPENYFSSLYITKNEVTNYSKKLKTLLQSWVENNHLEIAESVLNSLSKEILKNLEDLSNVKQIENNVETPPPSVKIKEKGVKKGKKGKLDPDEALPDLPGAGENNSESDRFLLSQSVPLLVELRNNNDLPALVFVRSQKLCDSMALEILRFMETNERFVLSKSDIKERRKQKKLEIKKAKAWKRERDRIDKRKEEEMMKEDLIPNVNVAEEDEEMDNRFAFVMPGERADEDDIRFWMNRVLWKNRWSRRHPFLRLIDRGIAVHHDGMTRAYKTLVEVMFRAKNIKVLLTVGTLVLGVNMPCRTTVFAGDSPDLTPLKYQQMIGRAGRRGYDNVGKVVFFGISKQKISYLMTSSLLTLQGHETMTMTTYLRNIFCLAEAADKKFRIRSFKNLAKESFGDNRKHSGEVLAATKLFYRYSMEFLYQNDLIDLSANPVGISGHIAHLYKAEPGNFVFAAMLKNGVFDSICRQIQTSFNEEKTKEIKANNLQVCTSLMEIMAHIFFLLPLPYGFRKPKYSSSKLCLDPLPAKAKSILDRFNATSISLYTQFHRLAAMTKISGEQNEGLPLSGIQFGKGSEEESFGGENKVAAKSVFAAITGSNDDFADSHDLRLTARFRDVSLEKTDSVPVVEMKDARGNDLPISAYAFDFFKQGSLLQIMKEYNLGELFAWNMLKNWSLLLRSIEECLSENALTDDKALAARRVDAFKTLSMMFDVSFKNISETVEYNYQ